MDKVTETAHDDQMTFEPPDPAAAPPSTPVPQAPEPVAPESGASDSVDGSNEPEREWSPVGIISALGVVFVLIAGLSVTLNRSGAQGEALRAVGLTVLAVGATLLADRIRVMAHTTALATAVLGAGVGFPVGVAFAAWGGQPWPVCLVAGALVAAPLAEWQRRRWPALQIVGRDVQWFDLIEVGALALGSFGLAAWASIPAGVVAASIAVFFVAVGACRRGIVIAVIAVTAPILGIFSAAGIGAGTMARAGVVGAPLGWSGPLVGAITGCAVFLAGRRLNNRRVRILAPPLFVVGCVTGFTQIEAGPAIWLSVPGLVLALAAGTWQLGRLGDQPFSPPGTSTNADAIQTYQSLLTMFGVIFGGILWLVSPVVVTEAIPGLYALTAAAWALGLGLCWPIVKGMARDVVLVGLAVTPTMAASALGSVVDPDAAPTWPTMFAVVVVSVVAAVAAARWGETPLAPVATLTTSYIGVIATMLRDNDFAGVSRAIPLLMVGAWLIAGVYAFSRFPRLAPLWLSVLSLVTAAAAALAVVVAGAFMGVGLAEIFAGMMFAVLATAVACASIPVARPILGWPVAVFGSLLLVLSRDSGITAALAAAFAATALLALVWNRWIASQTSAVIAGGSVAAAVVAVTAAVVRSPETTQLVTLGAIALAAGWGALRGRSLPAFAFEAIAALTAVTAAGLSISWMAATWCVVGVAASLVGVGWSQLWLTVSGAAVAVISAVVWVASIGVPTWLTGALDKLGLNGFDAACLVIFAVGIGVGQWIFQSTNLSSLILFVPSFVFVTITTIIAQVERQPVWVIPFAVVVGVLAIIIGVQRKVAGLLLGGIVVPSAIIITASRFTLVLVPGWVWIGAGGLALLATALVVERVAGGWSGVRRQAAYLSRTWK